MSQMYLHRKNFDICRICLLEPDVNRNIKFTRIFQVYNRHFTLQRQIKELLGIEIEKDGNEPKIICENCQNLLSRWEETKKRAAKSEITVNCLVKSEIASPTTSNALLDSPLNSNNEEISARVKPLTYKIETLPFKKRITKNVFKCKIENVQDIPLPSKHKLFTCLKPSCNLIFSSLNAFKVHHRRHFEYENKFICWLCCLPFSNMSDLRIHKMKDDCRTPGIFNCYECCERFNELESLSIHKLTFHNGNLASGRYTKKTIKCTFCHEGVLIIAFKNHMYTNH